MRFPRLTRTTILLAALALGWPLAGSSGDARAESRASSSKSPRARGGEAKRSKKPNKKARAERSRKTKVCKRSNGKRRCRWVARFDGHGVAETRLREEPLPRPSGEIWLYSVNSREEIKVNIYDADGETNPEAMAKLDHLFRCRRSGEERAVDPRLYEILSTIYDEFGQQRIELVSGFRNQPNEGSRHYHASAMDIKIPGVSVNELYEFASGLDTGGMGIGKYPSSGFVHVDWRAPGEKSYRWTDYSGPGDDEGGKKKRRQRKRQPNS